MSEASDDLREWIAAAGPRVRVRPPDARASRVAAALGVSERAMLSALATSAGALLVDDGWVRVLGGGVRGQRADLASWNGLGEAPVLASTPGMLLVGFDVLGGLFALDGGALGGERLGAVHYFAPDSLRWEPTGAQHSEWIAWLLTVPGALDTFYGPLRWPGWRDEVRALDLDVAIHTYPPPFTREGADLSRVSRRAIPAQGVVVGAFHAARQLDAPGVPGPRTAR